jgi:hypothetical protein
MNVTTSHDLAVMECPSCAGTFAILRSYKDEAYRLGKFKKCWTCPYCKVERGYGEGEANRHAKALAQKERELQQERDMKEYHRQAAREALQEANHFRASRDGMKGALNKVKKRVAHGVCPCCNRTFKQLAAHMAKMHPELLAKPEESP